MTRSGMFTIGARDAIHGLVMAVIAGFVTPILLSITQPDFSVFEADWRMLLDLAFNGAVIGAASYLLKKFFSSEDDKVLGSIG